jgi:hypothetical protein
MAGKIECDICKKTLDYKKTSFIHIYNRTEIDKGRFNESIDICNSCLKELKNSKTAKGDSENE